MELLDIVDKDNKLTGKTKERKLVHEEELWHRQTGCFIMNKKGELLFQKRSSNKDDNPNKWGKTGGHIEAGEEPISAIQREIFEEIGIKVEEAELELLSIDKNVYYSRKNKKFHKYYGYTYFTVLDLELCKCKIQKEELTNLRYISIEEMERIRKENNENYTFTNWKNFDEIIEYLKEKRELIKIK